MKTIILHKDNGYYFNTLIRTSAGKVEFFQARKVKNRLQNFLHYSGREAWNKWREWNWRLR